MHARAPPAHGHSRCTSLARFNDTSSIPSGQPRKTPVFVRFSTVAGSRGSTDPRRDVRGFAVKFLHRGRQLDLVGNNIPVLHPGRRQVSRLIHAVKPEPITRSRSASAHDTFGTSLPHAGIDAHDHVGDVGPRDSAELRMMEGFGVHTFPPRQRAGEPASSVLLEAAAGRAFRALGQALKISGKDPDFHRRDLWSHRATAPIPSGAWLAGHRREG